MDKYIKTYQIYSNIYILQVESVPLEEIRKASLLAEKLLCDKLDWVGGIEAAKACQVKVQQNLPSITFTNSNKQDKSKTPIPELAK